jgi:hypothetical protein
MFTSLTRLSPRSGGQDRQLVETVMGATVSAILFAAKKSEAALPSDEYQSSGILFQCEASGSAAAVVVKLIPIPRPTSRATPVVALALI